MLARKLSTASCEHPVRVCVCVCIRVPGASVVSLHMLHMMLLFFVFVVVVFREGC